MYKLSIKNIISFNVDSKTAKEFENLINTLEDSGVYMDFIYTIDSRFTTDTDMLIHIEKSPHLTSWNEISKEKYHYFTSEIVHLNLEFNPSLYFIFSSIHLNRLTNLIYDFYEGSDSIYVSFFVNKFLKEKKSSEKSTLCSSNHDEYYSDIEEKDLSQEYSDIAETAVSQFNDM